MVSEFAWLALGPVCFLVIVLGVFCELTFSKSEREY
jgi:hypothetical protein